LPVVPASNLDAGIDWHTRFFGRPPDKRAGDEVLWEINAHAPLFIEPNAAHAGADRITLAVEGFDALSRRTALASASSMNRSKPNRRCAPRDRPRSGWKRDRTRRAACRRRLTPQTVERPAACPLAAIIETSRLPTITMFSFLFMCAAVSQAASCS
jgi:hypothetical protein